MEKVQNFSDVKNVVRCWFLKLQHERKCTNTNLISKLVNNSTEDVQEQVRQLLSNDINEMVGKCKKSKDLTCMLNACNTINGCFDNFTHAADAVRYSFKEVLAFVDCTIDECQLETHKK
ncbi:hypothetical protein RUM43_005851 [Polyplax serrata]|uniref:Uncharacterized protein n=1 Tax=Polyplax serrata TaxID=468196 RepID=A0AAN8NWS8_POLSC